MKTKNQQDKIKSNFICLAEITAASGVRGEVQLRSFTAQAKDVAAYGLLYDASGTHAFKIVSLAQTKKSDTSLLRVRFEGVDDRDKAEALRGTRLYVARDVLPVSPLSQNNKNPDEFYYADLLGLAVRDETGAHMGRIDQIHNFGAGDILEINNHMIPFNKTYVPDININEGFVIIKKDEPDDA